MENSLVGLRRSQSLWPRDSHCPGKRCAVWKRPPGTSTQSKSKSALPPLRRRTTHSIASNATTQVNMISCCANGGATNSRKLQLRRGTGRSQRL